MPACRSAPTCPPPGPPPPAGMQKCLVYTVKSGDTGDAIASMYGVDLADVEALNPNVRSGRRLPRFAACVPEPEAHC